MDKHHFSTGEQIFRVGDAAENLYLILSGRIEVRCNNFIAVLEKGEIFGEAALLNKNRTLSAVALDDCILLSMTRDEMLNAFRENPEQAVEIIDAVFAKLVDTTDELIALKDKLEVSAAIN